MILKKWTLIITCNGMPTKCSSEGVTALVDNLER